MALDPRQLKQSALQQCGLSRFGAAPLKPCAADLAVGDLREVPSDVDHLLHFAWLRGAADELEPALKVNGEGAGLILHHCRHAKSALVTSEIAGGRGPN